MWLVLPVFPARPGVCFLLMLELLDSYLSLNPLIWHLYAFIFWHIIESSDQICFKQRRARSNGHATSYNRNPQNILSVYLLSDLPLDLFEAFLLGTLTLAQAFLQERHCVFGPGEPRMTIHGVPRIVCTFLNMSLSGQAHGKLFLVVASPTHKV